MGFWPFGRKNKRSSKLRKKTLEGPGDEKMAQKMSVESRQPHGPASGSGRGSTSNDSKRQKREVTYAAHPPPRSMPPSRAQTAPHSNHDVGSAQSEKASLQPHQASRALNSRAVTHDKSVGSTYYRQNPTSQSSIGEDNFTAIPRPPTLRAKRSSTDQGFNHRKSSKRKNEDRAREREIRALSSSPVPAKPLRTGDQLRRDTKTIPGGLNKRLERPSSNISLPLAESLNESLSEISEQHTFTVNSFSVLTPRPTLRYSDNPKEGPLRTMTQSRASARKDKQPMMAAADTKSKARINELADDLDASAIREIMERDQRRRERRRQHDQEKLQRKLERRAARQREEDRGRAVQSDDQPRHAEPSGNTEGGTQVMGLGTDGTTVKNEKPQSSEDPFSDNRAKSPQSWLEDPSREHIPVGQAENPFKDDTSEALALQGTKSGDTKEAEEELPLPPPIRERGTRLSQSTVNSQTSRPEGGFGGSSISQSSGLGRETTRDIGGPEFERRESDPSGRHVSSWTTFFRRGGTRSKRASDDRGRPGAGQSDFSNTSRESVPRPIVPPVITPRSFRRSGSTPVRTMSRFREDLPETPISPKVTTPEIPDPAGASPLPHPLVDKAAIEGSSGPSSAGNRESGTTSSEADMANPAIAHSLASVDSEASWFSGKPVKRSSHQSGHAVRESVNSIPPKVEEIKDDKAIRAGDDQLVHLNMEMHDQQETTRATGGDDSDNEMDIENPFPLTHTADPTPSSVEQFPTVVHAKLKAKSKEGLLEEFQSGASDEEATSPISPEGETPVSLTGPSEEQWVHRATSVDYGKGHARHISAGSARLLELPPRTSIDSKRLSSEGKAAAGQGGKTIAEKKQTDEE